MAKLTTKQRKMMPPSQFAGPGRSYPIPDRSHAANAMGRATQMEHRGLLSPTAASAIKSKANAKLRGR
jgi:hypothetical protein